MLTSVYLAAEDDLGLAVGNKLVEEAKPLFVYRDENARGYGKLKSKTPQFQKMASSGFPVLMITDLDARQCPSGMIGDWLGASPSAGFLFRVCVREVEAWLLAHRSAMASFFGLPMSRLPKEPELLADPKAKLIAIAQLSPHRNIRTGLKPVGSSKIGPDYNRLLGDFIRKDWIAADAALVSPSLARARKRIREFARTLQTQQPS